MFMHSACAALHHNPNVLSPRFARFNAQHVSAASADQELNIKLLLQQDEHHHNHGMQPSSFTWLSQVLRFDKDCYRLLKHPRTPYGISHPTTLNTTLKFVQEEQRKEV